MDIKDRIKQVMEDLHMNQQSFAEFIEQAPGTLSSIFNGRTRPTLNILDAIKKKIPDISIEWLIYGNGEPYVSKPPVTEGHAPEAPGNVAEPMIDFDAPTPHSAGMPQQAPPVTHYGNGVRNTHSEVVREEVKIFNKEPRRVTEIRVYYDDQTYETFVPAKK